MKLPNTAHTTLPWRIHELTGDFRLEDVWALPTPGDRDDFPRLVQQMVSGDPYGPSLIARLLWEIRWKIGELLDWDHIDSRRSELPTLRDRLPADLREGPPGPEFEALPLQSLYLTNNEWIDAPRPRLAVTSRLVRDRWAATSWTMDPGSAVR